MKNMLILAVRAAWLRGEAFRHVMDDPDEILKSVGTVLMASILFGLGLAGVVGEVTANLTAGSLADRLLDLWLVAMTMLVGWVLWAISSYVLGGKFLHGNGGFREVLRAQGIAYGPLALALLWPLPTVGPPMFFVGIIWVLAAGVVGVREVQGNDWFSAVLTALPGWVMFCFGSGLLAIMLTSVSVQEGGG